MTKQIKVLLLGLIAVFLFIIPVNVSAQSTTVLDISNVWFDNDNADQLRPDSVTVNIFADGVLVKTQEVSIANQNQGNPSQWSVNQINLDSLNADGSAIEYTFTVTPVANYTTEVTPSKSIEQITSGGGRSGRAQTGGIIDTVTTYQLVIFNTEAAQPTPTSESSTSTPSTSTSDSSTQISSSSSTSDSSSDTSKQSSTTTSSTDKISSVSLNNNSDKGNSNDKQQVQSTSSLNSTPKSESSSQTEKKENTNLPITGEQSSVFLILLGLIIVLVTFVLIRNKRK